MASIIAENVKSIINQKGLKQSAVAAFAGYNTKTFNNMLNGRKLVTDSDVEIIAKVLKVTPNELFGYKE